jgi:phosphonate transport system substrate-binding protein
LAERARIVHRAAATRRGAGVSVAAAGATALWVVVLGGLGSQASAQAPASPVYSVAVVPQFPAADVHRDWTPLLERLSRDTGLTLVLKISTSIPRFETEVLAGTPDFAFMNPYHEVMAMRAQGYLPLVRDSKLLSGILVVRKDDPIKSTRELDGKTLVFPAPNAFGASLWMRALLAEREHIAITPRYVQTHGNVYRQVIRGTAAAGGGVNNTLAQESDEVRADLRVLVETPGVPPHPIAAHPRVPAKARNAVAMALVRMADDPAGQQLLKDIAMPRPVAADYARDYQPLERFRLDRYVVVERPAD